MIWVVRDQKYMIRDGFTIDERSHQRCLKSCPNTTGAVIVSRKNLWIGHLATGAQCGPIPDAYGYCRAPEPMTHERWKNPLHHRLRRDQQRFGRNSDCSSVERLFTLWGQTSINI